jgi:nucleoside permease NupC
MRTVLVILSALEVLLLVALFLPETVVIDSSKTEYTHDGSAKAPEFVGYVKKEKMVSLKMSVRWTAFLLNSVALGSVLWFWLRK